MPVVSSVSWYSGSVCALAGDTTSFISMTALSEVWSSIIHCHRLPSKNQTLFG